MHLPRFARINSFSLEQKLVFFFLVISGIPLFVGNILWSYAARENSIHNRSSELQRVAQLGAREIDAFIEAKLISLVIHSQTEAILTGRQEDAVLELQNFLLQDADIAELLLMDDHGMEMVHLIRGQSTHQQHESRDVSESTAFKVTTFVGGERYISPVYQDKNGESMIDIAVPIVIPEGSRAIRDVSTSSVGEVRRAGEIHGVLQSSVRVKSLADVLQKMKIGMLGYVFVIDDKGTVVFHPHTQDQSVPISVRGMAEVETFLYQSPQIPLSPDEYIPTVVSQRKNEFGQSALTTATRAKTIHWGVIAQEPLSEVVADATRYMIVAFIIFLLFFIIAVVVSFWFASQLVRPIKVLAYGSYLFGTGALDHRIMIRTGDELEDLARAFNQMAQKLSGAFLTVINEKNILSAERNKLQVILSGIRDPVIAVDFRRTIILFNHAAEVFSGLKEESMIGLPLEKVMTVAEAESDVQVDVYCPMRPDGSAGILFQKQNVRVVFTGGVKRYADMTTAKIREGKEVNLGALITMHDVTAEAQLEEMKIDFVSMAAHELRTPLTAIRGYLQLLMTDADASFSSGQSTIISRIDLAATRLSALVQNLLSVSRIERGALTLALEQADWPLMITQAIEELEPQAGDKHIRLTFVAPVSHIPPVRIDKLRMTEVLTNLISNAISYTPSGGSITVRVEYADNAVVTHISDTGQGIPSDAQPHLFKKFFRVSGPLEQGSKGTGLGLYICREILTLHKGKIWVESVVGKGSTFSFLLPAA